MKLNRSVILTLLFLSFLLVVSTTMAAPLDTTNPLMETQALSQQKEQSIRAAISDMSVPFIANHGQVDEQVAFYADTFGGRVFVTKKGEIVHALARRGKLSETVMSSGSEDDPHADSIIDEQSGDKQIGGVALKERFNSADSDVVRGEGVSTSKVNYFIGDQSRWKQNIPAYDTVSLGEIYPGIELKLRAYSENVEKLFHVRPGGDHRQIHVTMEGAQVLTVLESGEMEVGTKLGLVRFSAPIAYQDSGGQREYVQVAYQVDGNKYSFDVGQYDTGKELVIDPVLVSTFLGSDGSGEGEEYFHSIAIDADGNVFVAGYTETLSFPVTSGAYDQSHDAQLLNQSNANYDVFISRFSSDLSSLTASTFIGGVADEEDPCLAFDSSGNVYVAGTTVSGNFPTTSSAYDKYFNYGVDIFIARFSPDLSTLSASTYLGGSSAEELPSIAIAGSGNVYVAGSTASSNFPTTSGSYDESHNGGSDVFVTSLTPNLNALNGSTFLGGSLNEYASIAIDTSGNVFIAGNTGSSNFPLTSGVFDTSFAGINEAYIASFSSDLSSLSASTYLGGSSADYINALAVDGSGDIYVTGGTYSTNFPTTSGAYDESSNGGYDVFVSHLSSNLVNLQASTYLGGSSDEEEPDLTLDGSDNVYVTGITGSSNFPVTTGASHNGEDDVFIVSLNPGLTSLSASTLLGGSDFEYKPGISLNSTAEVYVAGYTRSENIPVSTGAYDETFNGAIDVFISRFPADLAAISSSTYFGQAPGDESYAVAVDDSGNVYVCGKTWSSEFPVTTGAYDESYTGGADIFVSLLSSDLTSLSVSTYLGGSSEEDNPALAIGDSGNVFVGGQTSSSDFPVTGGVYDDGYNGDTDAFVARLSPTLSTPFIATFLGGSSAESDISLAADDTGNIYVAGHTTSTDFPATAGSYEPAYQGNTDLFVALLPQDLSGLSAATFLGGSSSEKYPFLALGSAGSVYVTGETYSSDFPTTTGVYDVTLGGSSDVFVSRLSSSLDELESSTYLGGSSYEYIPDLVVDSQGGIYVTGETRSSDFPVTTGTYDTSLSGGEDIFIAHLSSGLTELSAATFLGGATMQENDPSIDLDNSDNVYISGTTCSSDFPVTAEAYDQTLGGWCDVFASKLSSDLVTLNSSTFLGGGFGEENYDMVLGPADEMVIVGRSYSTDFPTSVGAYDTDNSHRDDGFVVKLYLSRQLSIDFQGDGTGSVNLNPPDIDLSDDGSQNYDEDTVVTLTATPGTDSIFEAWSGDADCEDGEVTMDASFTCIATFVLDTDGDGTPDGSDGCPADSAKTDPGTCGCGVADTDSDGDGTADCNDECPADSAKTDPGTCGCGIADTDSDGDGTADCNDECPADSAKTDPGTCGCGVADTDSDGDGTADCNDNCPDDSAKTDPGTCGCGVADTDSDGDGTADCNDECPYDSAKTDPGTCGCGVADTDSDGDGTADCNDNCPDDSGKTDPGTCGCGVADTDSDEDGTADCNDGCPDDSGKTEPGTCGCGVADTDTDGDGTADCNDECETDGNKTEQGVCGCNVPDINSDDDEMLDCVDSDDDNDGMPDTWEIQYGLNPLVNDADEDPDNDGYTNYEEYMAGTNPNSSPDFPWELFYPAFMKKK